MIDGSESELDECKRCVNDLYRTMLYRGAGTKMHYQEARQRFPTN